ncbi:MAG: ferredoxin reductase [Actinobacteria bacterium]|nr:ferredoxin reductase [Actinomycetota bacterium]
MWRSAVIADVTVQTHRTRTLTLAVDGWMTHRAGQHVDLRLTADDGYQAARSYSLASGPGEPPQVTVDRLPDGEVSPYLVDIAAPGDALELRGPVGGYFVWSPQNSPQPPVLLIAGGSGVVPLHTMLRARLHAGDDTPMRLLYSARSWDDVIYRDELRQASSVSGVTVEFTLTRDIPPGWSGHTGRLDAAMLTELSWPATDRPDVFVCGPTRFVEAIADTLVDLGHDPAAVRTERFGG